MSRGHRREITPIWRDVVQGTTTRMTGGRFVMNDGESKPVYNRLLLQENGLPILQENGQYIYLEDANVADAA